MIAYILYRIGIFLASSLPLGFSYAAASGMADIFRSISPRDRANLMSNLRVVLGPGASEKDVAEAAHGVFRNFAKYLVDFFSFRKIDEEYLKRRIKITGEENLKKALAMGKGVIALSAHMGNWELGGAVIGAMGYSISAVVLTHTNKRINDFFTRQRLAGNMRPIETGMFLKGCYRTLQSNGILALLGDRDFSGNGLKVKFFGMEATVPKGPAVLSRRLGSPIVPIFMVREPDDNYRLIIEEPIMETPGLDEAAGVLDLTQRCCAAIGACIRKYPSQWYAFRKIWNIDNEKSLRPDTII